MPASIPESKKAKQTRDKTPTETDVKAEVQFVP